MYKIHANKTVGFFSTKIYLKYKFILKAFKSESQMFQI